MHIIFKILNNYFVKMALKLQYYKDRYGGKLLRNGSDILFHTPAIFGDDVTNHCAYFCTPPSI